MQPQLLSCCCCSADARRSDPCCVRCLASFRPVMWSMLPWFVTESKGGMPRHSQPSVLTDLDFREQQTQLCARCLTSSPPMMWSMMPYSLASMGDMYLQEPRGHIHMSQSTSPVHRRAATKLGRMHYCVVTDTHLCMCARHPVSAAPAVVPERSSAETLRSPVTCLALCHARPLHNAVLLISLNYWTE